MRPVGATDRRRGARVVAADVELDEDQVELVRIAAEELQARRTSRALGSPEAVEDVARVLLASSAAEAGLRCRSPRGLAAVPTVEASGRVDALEAVDGTASPLPRAGLRPASRAATRTSP